MRFRPVTSPRRLLAAVAVAALATSPARADLVSLTSAGSSAVINGALLEQADPHPTGTGVFDPFVRIQMNGYESGFNTDAKKPALDAKAGTWTRSLLLSSLVADSYKGTNYYKFALDINEQANAANSLISLNDFQLFLANSPTINSLGALSGPGSVKVFDLDGAGDKTIVLDYNTSGSGSGTGDLFVYVPTASFQGRNPSLNYVYLYSSFGSTDTKSPLRSDAGFEEWAHIPGSGTTPPPPPPTNNPVPAPAGAVLAALGLGCGVLGRGFRRRTAV